MPPPEDNPDQAIADLRRQLAERTAERDEAWARQTATADVLKVISQSAFDLDVVMNTLAGSARELCSSDACAIFLLENEVFHGRGLSAVDESTANIMRNTPVPLDAGTNMGKAVLERRIVNVADFENTPTNLTKFQQLIGFQSFLAVPLLRDGRGVGVILLTRTPKGGFTQREIDLVSTFANQAVIAIEDSRLFNETKEALERQTATSEILRVISQSPTDVQPVFDAINLTAVRLLGCDLGFVLRCDGNTYSPVAAANRDGPLAELGPANLPIDPAANFPSRAILSKKILHLPDWSKIDLPEHERNIRDMFGVNSSLFLPLLRGEECIGLLALAGSRLGNFAESELALAESFRDQALIAIENTRLFNEVQARTKELAKSLDELRAAQDRLIQTEKLASLGQLTAGIAHEIKNPLNFVNNFAALSAELTDELNGILNSATLTDKIRAEVDELTRLLKGNLQKVVQHGKRADSIVKNMLLHSREGSGEHRPTDINALVEESLNLAYHGARAEKPQFNITIERDLDPAAGTIDVFPQEITRVLLNLISNGFYAVSKRRSETAGGFEPVLRASTQARGDRVEIRIRDNGIGIPPDVKEKMFNPFFTTKPAGEGTGLGLSMSHDIIVKQHGGTIDVDTLPGEFTELTIQLPRKSNLSDKSRG
ncbi:GAF domain-containing protein [Bradyrhizobium manausense]|nr:GAF domain-containing protein [Bradyrhizobium manausense]UVO33404.1 GAF domain-containing protein [Bradyrhizobium arachidis]